MNLDKLKEASFYCLKNTIRNLSFPSNHITIHLCLIGNLSFLLVDVNYAVFILFFQRKEELLPLFLLNITCPSITLSFISGVTLLKRIPISESCGFIPPFPLLSLPAPVSRPLSACAFSPVQISTPSVCTAAVALAEF